MNTENRPYLALAAIFIIGAVVGFLVKSALKSKITSSPDDRRITAVQQIYDFKAAKERMDKEMQQMQEQQMQGGQEVQPGETVPVPNQ